MDSKVWTRRAFLKGAGVATAALLAGCAPKIVEVTRVVKEKEIVKETVVVSKEVAKEVTKVVQQTVVVEKIKDVAVLRFHMRLGDAQRTLHDKRVLAMQEKYPGVKVNVEEFPMGSAEYGPKIAALVAGGSVGDVTWTAFGSGSFQFLAGNKALAPIDEMINADKSGFKLDVFYPRVIKGLRLGPSGQGSGELFGLPTSAHGNNILMFFNKDLIEKAGLKAPTDDTSREDLLDIAKKLTKDGTFGLQLVTGDYSSTRNLTLPFGAELISEDGKQSLLEDEKFKQGIKWAWDCYFTHKISPTAKQITGNQDQMFLAGKLAIWQSGGWGAVTCRSVVKDTFKWDMAMMPKGPAGNRGGHLHADGMCITKLSKQKPMAYEFIKFLTDQEAGVQQALFQGLAPRFDSFTDARVTKDPMVIRIGKTTEEAADHRGSFNLRKQELQTTVNAIFGPVWTGDKPLDNAFYAEASKTLQTFLDKKTE